MKKQANRKAIVISAALTMLLLTFVGGGVLMVSQIFAQPIDSQSSTPAVEQSSVSQDAAVAAPVTQPLHRPAQPMQRPLQWMPRLSPLTKPSSNRPIRT